MVGVAVVLLPRRGRHARRPDGCHAAAARSPVGEPQGNDEAEVSERQITVQILGDAASLERAFAKSSASATAFEGHISTSSRNAEKELARVQSGPHAGSAPFTGRGPSRAV